MERGTKFMGWKNQCFKDGHSPQISLWFDIISVKISSGFFVDIKKLI